MVPNSKSRWLVGPEFLHREKSTWPENQNDFPICEDEMKKEFIGIAVEISKDSALPKSEKFSPYVRLIRATAWVLRFIRRCQRNCDVSGGELTLEELNASEKLWWKNIQENGFAEEIYEIQKKKNVKSDKMRKIHIWMKMVY
ncbi:hypothetical protein JTB14_028234 [Gonioctena quinquepunctata]|nr:hypothetical protein JTB14_028234 [Gonioctena quinquepunctata]